MLFTEWNWDDALRVSREEGVEEGIQQGVQLGIEQGVQLGRQEGTMKTLCDLVVSGVLALADAVKNAGITQAEFMGWMKQFYPNHTL